MYLIHNLDVGTSKIAKSLRSFPLADPISSLFLNSTNEKEKQNKPEILDDTSRIACLYGTHFCIKYNIMIEVNTKLPIYIFPHCRMLYIVKSQCGIFGIL